MSRLWLFLAVALPVLAAVLAPLSSVDLAYQLRAGGEIIDRRAIPSVDTWTFTAAGLPWVDQQWGAQVVLAAVYRLAGWTGLVVLRAALTGVLVAATLVAARRRGCDTRIAAILTLIAFVVAAPAMALRPQLFGMVCFALTLLLVAERFRTPRALWLVPVIVMAWANLHGSFVLAPIILGLTWIEDLYERRDSARSTLLVAAVSVAAACLTPFGPAVWTYAVGLTSNAGVTARTTEWQPTSLRDPTGLLFFASVAAVIVVIARGGRRISWPTLLWLGVFAAIGAFAQRGIAWWPFAAVASPLATYLPAPTRAIAPGSPRFNAVVAAAVLFATVALLPAWRPVDTRTGVPVAVLTDAPPGITETLRGVARPGDRILNPQIWGSWFEFALPDALVSVDSRIEFFPATVWADLERVSAGIGDWAGRLRSWGVSIVVVTADDTGLRDRLGVLGWRPIHSDEDGTVLVREPR